MRKKIFKKLGIVTLLLFWFFSGWPVIWQNPRIPPKIKEVQAAVANNAASESHTGTTSSTSQASFTWTHTPVGTPRGVSCIRLHNFSHSNSHQCHLRWCDNDSSVR